MGASDWAIEEPIKTILRILKLVGLVIGLLVVTLAVLLYFTFSGGLAVEDGQRVGLVEAVRDGMVSAFIVDIDPTHVALVDAGNDREAKAILRALARRDLTADAVKAIFLTHGDGDHTAGVLDFPQAQVMALEPDVGLAEGREKRGIFKLFGAPRPNGIKVARVLHDGETVDLGGVLMRAFAIPGHTKGSAAYLTRSILFMGDSAESTSEKKLAPGHRLFTENPPLNRASLRALAQRLEPLAGEVSAIAPAHSGLLTDGLKPLRDLAVAIQQHYSTVERLGTGVAQTARLAGSASPDMVEEALGLVEQQVIPAVEAELEVAPPFALSPKPGPGPVGAAEIGVPRQEAIRDARFPTVSMIECVSGRHGLPLCIITRWSPCL